MDDRKAPEDWLEDESGLIELAKPYPLEYASLRTTLTKLKNEREAAEFERKIKEQEAMLELERKKRELTLEDERQRLEIDSQKTKFQEQQTSKELGRIEAGIAQRRSEFELSMQRAEFEHKQKMSHKEQELKVLQKERVRMQTDMDVKIRSQEMARRKEAEELDKKMKKERQALERKMMTDESDLRSRLASDQHEFRKKLEEDRLRMEREADELFHSRVTTDLEITKADGSKLVIRETEPGLVSHMTSGLFSDSVDTLKETDEHY